MSAEIQTDPFLQDLESFMARTGTTDSRLGRAALGDPSFVREVRRGRRIRQATKRKLQDYMLGGTTP